MGGPYIFANSSKSQIILLQRQPLNQRPATTATTATAATVRFNKALVKAALKNKIDREVASEPFSKWRAKQLEKMKSKAAFPTQVVWYVRTAFVPKISPYVSHIDLINGSASFVSTNSQKTTWSAT
jgi:hypothetical protein